MSPEELERLADKVREAGQTKEAEEPPPPPPVNRTASDW